MKGNNAATPEPREEIREPWDGWHSSRKLRQKENQQNPLVPGNFATRWIIASSRWTQWHLLWWQNPERPKSLKGSVNNSQDTGNESARTIALMQDQQCDTISSEDVLCYESPFVTCDWQTKRSFLASNAFPWLCLSKSVFAPGSTARVNLILI